MEKNYSFPAGQINSVRIKLTWAQLEIIKGGQEAFHVHVAGYEDRIDEIRVEEKENELFISQPNYTAAKEIVPIKRWIQVCIRLPEGWSGDIDASTVSGMISAHRIDGDDVAFTTVSGSMHVKSISGSHVGIRSITGSIISDTIHAKHLFLRTVSGKANVSNVHSTSSKVFTVSANVNLQLNNGCKSVDIQSISGDIHLEVEGPVKETSLRSLGGQFLLDEEIDKNEEGLDISSTSVSGSLTVKRFQK